VSAASPARAAWTTEKCLAKKRLVWAARRSCEAGAAADLVRGKPADLEKCVERFSDALAGINARAARTALTCRYRDNGDGTVIDYDTALQWEKKESPDDVEYLPNPHDVDNQYDWTSVESGIPTYMADGSVFTDFLARLNGSAAPLFDIATCASADGTAVAGGFASHCDWRLPTILELETIFQSPCDPACIDPIFGPTATERYFSSTTDVPALGGQGGNAWNVHFLYGFVQFLSKTNPQRARAVRNAF
jgi:hypothetical protein